MVVRSDPTYRRRSRHEDEREIPIRHGPPLSRMDTRPQLYDSSEEAAYGQHDASSDTRSWQEPRDRQIAIATEQMRAEAASYPPALREYLEISTGNGSSGRNGILPISRGEDVMRLAGQKLFELGEDPRYLAESSAAFLNRLQFESGLEASERTAARDEFEDARDQIRAEHGVVPAGRPKTKHLMRWAGFQRCSISRDTDILGERQKSFIATAQAVEIALPSPIGSFSVKGVFGIIAQSLMLRDYRAYFKAAEQRKIFIPDTISPPPEDATLEDYERNLLGLSHYNGSGGSPMMTCLNYTKDYGYGAITLFEVGMVRKGSENWPDRITPVSMMKKVPKAILIKMAKSVPSSKKTMLRVRGRKADDPLKWTSGASDSDPYVGTSKRIASEELSWDFQNALAINPEEYEGPSNVAVATIPEMLAWLHVKTSYLQQIQINGIEFREVNERVWKIASWRKGPEIVAHEGKDPCIVVLHPDQRAWVTTPLYWT